MNGNVDSRDVDTDRDACRDMGRSIDTSRSDALLLGKPLRICFDLDDTILDSNGAYYTAQPKKGVVEFMHELKEQGHTLIIHTARKMATYSGNTGKALVSIGALTFQQIESFNIPCDEIYFGKPSADLYLDDKAINALDESLLKERVNNVIQSFRK